MIRSKSCLSPVVRRILVAVAIAALIAVVAACGGSKSSNASADAAKAKTVATAADARLATDGYAALHLPGFGKVDAGYRTSSPRYEAVYTYTGTNVSLVQNIVTAAQKKLASAKGVVILYAGKLIVARTNSVSALKKAAEAVLSSAPAA